MPTLSIQGNKVERVVSAAVRITHGDAKEALQYPICQFEIELPLDEKTAIAEWALAPQGVGRWKTVELNTLDRSSTINHTWTLKKAYIHNYEEVEFPPTSGGTEQGNLIRLIVRGTLIHDSKQTYDGKNVLEVKAGEAEPQTS